jgi:hypothetical protein
MALGLSFKVEGRRIKLYYELEERIQLSGKFDKIDSHSNQE